MKRRALLTLLIAGCLASTLIRAEDAVFDSNGVKIRYVTEGTGEAVVLIHHFKIVEGADHITTLIEFLRSGKLKEAGGRG